MKWFASLVALAVLVACGSSSPPSLHATNYDRNCGADSDCIAIADTSQCECPLCSTRAINAADEMAYAADQKAYEDACKGTPCSNLACPIVTPYCDNGTCEVK